MPSLSPQQRRERETRRASEQARILRVLRLLRSWGTPPDLDIIDGEFYFRCCVPGCDEVLNALAARHLADQLAAADGTTSGPLGTTMHRLATDLHLRFAVPPFVAEGFVFRDEPLRLRGLDPIVIRSDETLTPTSIRIRIYSGATTGQELAAQLTTLCDRLPSWNQSPAPRFSLDFYGDHGTPHLALTLGLPLSPRSIGVAYDALAPAFNSQLAEANQQTGDTACRTWTIALLMKQAGLRLDHAQAEWLRATQRPSDEEIPAALYKRNKRALLSRVPEATSALAIRTSTTASH